MEGIPINLNVTPKTDMERLLEGIDKEKEIVLKLHG